MTDRHEWKVGDEVALKFGFDMKWGPIVTVEKIYKNGNVILSDHPKQQWRPMGTSLHPTGQGTAFARRHAVLVTDEVRQQRREALRVSKAKVRIREAIDVLHMMVTHDPLAVPDHAIDEIIEVAEEKRIGW